METARSGPMVEINSTQTDLRSPKIRILQLMEEVSEVELHPSKFLRATRRAGALERLHLAMANHLIRQANMVGNLQKIKLFRKV